MVTVKKSDKPFVEAAEKIAVYLNSILVHKQYAVLGVPGGRSAGAIFEELAQQKIDWERVHIFLVDERFVPMDDVQSNMSLVQNHLVKKLENRLPEKNVHAFNCDVDAYNKEFQSVTDMFDVILLSAGEDGHIASLFPHKSIMKKEPRFIEIHDSPKPPVHRISASRTLLEKTQYAVVVFIGKAKTEAFHQFRDEEVSIESCPAKLVYSLNDTTVFRG